MCVYVTVCVCGGVCDGVFDLFIYFFVSRSVGWSIDLSVGRSIDQLVIFWSVPVEVVRSVDCCQSVDWWSYSQFTNQPASQQPVSQSKKRSVGTDKKL